VCVCQHVHVLMATLGKNVVGAIGAGAAAAVAGVGAIAGGAVKVVKGIGQAVAEVNPSTLSGATDIIIVELPDGSRKSSPFHVRFGKFKAVYPKDRIVDVYCNDEQASFCLRLSKSGEAHVLPTGNPGLLLSPLTSPTLSPRQSPPPPSVPMPSSPSSSLADHAVDIVETLQPQPTVPRRNVTTAPLSPESEVHDDVAGSASFETFQTHLHGYINDETVAPHNEESALDSTMPPLSNVQASAAEAVPTKGWLSGFKFWGQNGPTVDAAHASAIPHASSSSLPPEMEPSLIPTSEQLASLKLNRGYNKICFEIASTGARIQAGIYLWSSNTKIVVSDVDGTITKSDALGQIYPKFGKDWTQAGVVRLLHLIQRNGYETLYVTARHIGYSQQTKDYLRGLQQQGFKLPEGPVITSPDRLWGAFKREVIQRRPEVFKMQCFSEIRALFPSSNEAPFWAGFGNRVSDAASYSSVGVPQCRIYTVNESGELRVASSAAVDGPSSYSEIQEYVNVMFPSLHRVVEQESNQEFNPINFWMLPLHKNPALSLSSPGKKVGATTQWSSPTRDIQSDVFNNPSSLLDGLDDLD
jgi:phosphatidate phosphatase LPIN